MKSIRIAVCLFVSAMFAAAAPGCAADESPPTVGSPPGPATPSDPQKGARPTGDDRGYVPQAGASESVPSRLDDLSSFTDDNPDHVTVYRAIDDLDAAPAVSDPADLGDGLGRVSQAACKLKTYSCPANGKPAGLSWVQSGTTQPYWCYDQPSGSNYDTCYWYRTVNGPPWQATVIFTVPADTACPRCWEDGAAIPAGTGTGCANYTPVWNTVECGHAGP